MSIITPLAAAMSRGDAPWSAALAAFGAVHGLSPADFAHFGVGPALVAVSALFLALLPYQILSTLPRGVHRALGFDAWLIQPVSCAARSAGRGAAPTCVAPRAQPPTHLSPNDKQLPCTTVPKQNQKFQNKLA